MRMYNIVAINEKTNTKTYCTSYSMTHEKCCTMLSKFTPYSGISLILEEVGVPIEPCNSSNPGKHPKDLKTPPPSLTLS